MDEFKHIVDQFKGNAKEYAEAKQDEQDVIARYGELFHPKNIGNLTVEDFKSFLLFKNNRHWKGIFRTGNLITSDMAKLRDAMKILLDESQPLERRLNALFPPNQSTKYIRGIDKAIATPILLVVYPDTYGVWNEPSQQGLKQLNRLPQFVRRASFADKYIKINDVLNDLARQYSLSLWQVDRILGIVSGRFH